MAAILQGTTPTVVLTVYNDNNRPLDLTDVVSAELTIAQHCPGNWGKKTAPTVIVHTYDVTIDAAASTVSYSMTEAETLALNPERSSMFQLRLKYSDGNIIGTPYISFSTYALLVDTEFGEA